MKYIYPIREANTKRFDFHKLFLYVAIIVLAILLFKACNKSSIIAPPVVIKGKEVHDTISVIDNQYKRLRDSFMVVLNRKYKDDDENYQAYLKLLNENSVLLNENNMLSQPVPDTCKELQAGWVDKFNKVKVSSDKKDVAANKTISGLQSTVSIQKKFLATKDSSYSRLKSIADTCAIALTELEKYTRKIKPKREINVGLEVNSQWVNLKPTIGIGLGYRDRRGTQVNAAIYSNKSITVGVKKTLFKF